MLRVVELFSGIGAQTQALKNIGVEHEVVAIAEIDEPAIASYTALHGEPKLNLGDITKLNPKEVPDHDLLTYSFPCQSIAICGAQEGLDEGSGTESSTLWYCQDIIQEKLPKYLLMENVKNLIGRTHVDNFHKWLNILSSLGYTSYYSILNAKDFNVPQNRERIFVVSIREDREEKYIFPEPVKLEKDMYDILIDDLPEGNFVMEHLLYKRPHYEESFQEGTLNYVGMIDMRGNESIRRVYHPSGICPTLTTMDGGHRQPKFLLDDGRVRKLTPQECWRLMGFSDEQYEKIDFQSNRQKYRQAGNSIVVPVLEGIFTNLFKPNKD